MLTPYSVSRFAALNASIRIEQVGAPSIQQDASKIRVAAYNIAHGRGSELGASNWNVDPEARAMRLADIGRFLEQSEVDIVVLNEVDFQASWSGGIDQAEIIAKAGGYSYLARQSNYRVRFPGFALNFGNAILSRYPILHAERLPLTPMKKYESIFFGSKDAVLAKIEVSGVIVDVFGVHLEVRDKTSRKKAVEDISSRVSLGGATLILGDFNSQPDSQTPGSEDETALSQMMRLTGFNAFPYLDEPEKTFPAKNPNRALDWILYSEDLKVIRGSVPRDIDYSDHLPVIANLEFLKD